MMFNMMKAKIHRATVTQADLHYEGSISICPTLLAASGILSHEQVDVVNVHNGARLTTYAIEGEVGQICLNGPAARLVQPGDLVIVIAYAMMPPEEAKTHKPTVVFVDSKNVVKTLTQKSGTAAGKY